ncbi:MAG: DJ-1 family glyoxalase III [Chitinivibrionales bacterium]
MVSVLVPIADGTEEIEVVTIIDTLRRAGADVTVASVMSRRQIEASRGVQIVADRLLEECVSEQYDCIVLAGGKGGAENFSRTSALIEMLQKQKESGRLYAAICASPALVLQPHGLLEDKLATCFPSFEEKLQNREATGRRVVEDDNCVTSQGPGTAMEFALKLVELLYGKEKQQKIADALLAPVAVSH